MVNVPAGAALGHTVVARIAGHGDRLGPGAEQLEPAAVVVADRADAIEGTVRRLGPLTRRPPQPGAFRRHGGRDQAELHAPVRGGEGELGPHVQLAEDEGRRLEGVEHRLHVAGPVEGEVVSHVHGQVAGQALGRGGEEREGELPLRLLGAQGFEHGLGLQPLADGRRVHPHERPARVAMPPGPVGEAGGEAAAGVQPAGQLLVEPGGEGRRAGGEVHAQAIEEGRAPHSGSTTSVVLPAGIGPMTA
jgi:hypothetical protein